MKYRRALNLLLIFVLLSLQVSAQISNASNHCESEDLYDSILETVFPRTALDSLPGFGVVLRFRPSFDAESQISIEKKGTKFIVTEYRVIGDSIWNRLYELDPIDRDQVALIAAKMPVRVKVVSVEGWRMKQWMREFYEIFTLSLQAEKLHNAKNSNEMIQMDDGTRYEIWYRGQYRFYYRRQGAGIRFSSPTEDSVIRWMKRVGLKIASK